MRERDLLALWRRAREAGLATPNVGLLTNIVCCPGGDFCALANAKSIPVAEAIQRRFDDLDYLHDIGELDLNISGCMNSCGHHHIGHIGILGVDKNGSEWYQVSIGGEQGINATLGQVIGPSFAAAEMPGVIEGLVETYLENRTRGRALRRHRAPHRHRRPSRPACTARNARWPMPRHVIRHGEVIGDIWQVLVPREGESAATVALPEGPLAVSLAVWKARREELLARSSPVGVRLDPADDPEEIAADLPRLALVAVHFPKFADGRGYSTACLLRRRLGYRGELRAVGDVLRDQLFYLARSGFDAFQLREGADPHAALPSLDGLLGRLPGVRGRPCAPVPPRT